MSTTERFLIALGIVFAIPYLIWRLGRTDYLSPTLKRVRMTVSRIA